MTIVTYHHRPKRAPPKKRKRPPIANRIVTPPKLKLIKGLVIRLADASSELPKIAAPAIVDLTRSRHRFGAMPDLMEEEVQRRSEAAWEL